MEANQHIDFLLDARTEGMHFEPHNKKGFEFKPDEDDSLRFILKPTKPDEDDCGDTAWLYIVINCKYQPELFRIQNPTKTLKFQQKSKGVQYFLPMAEWKGKI